MGAPSTNLEPIRILTRCATRDQFVAMFRRFCTATTCFIPSRDRRPAGLAVAFSIRLHDGTPMLRGEGVVLEAWTTGDNPYRRPGIKLGIHHLTPDSTPIHEELVAATGYAVPLSPAAQLAMIQQRAPGPATVETVTPTVEIPPLERPDAPRRAGSADVLPANPLSELGDDGIAAFVDCSLEAVLDPEAAAAPAAAVEPVLDGDATERVDARPALGTLVGVSPLAPRPPAPVVPRRWRRVPVWAVATLAAAAAVIVVLGAVR